MNDDPNEISIESLDTEIFTNLNIGEAERLLGGTNTSQDTGGIKDPDQDC